MNDFGYLGFNSDILSDFDQTISYYQYKDIITNGIIYNSILSDLIEHIRGFAPDFYYIDKSLVSRILSYYVLPQNHNNLKWGSMYKFDSDIRNICFPYLRYGIIEYKSFEYNTYIIFTKVISDYIERLLNRYINLEYLVGDFSVFCIYE